MTSAPDWRLPTRDFQAGGRSAVIGENGAAATSLPLATLTAIETLKSGGNAVDAAIAAAGVLAVIEPHMTGIGGDVFALVARPGQSAPIAYNGAGRSGASARAEWFLERGIKEIGEDDVHSITVPGAVDAWCRLAQDHGKLGIDRLLQPAIKLAEEGFRIAPRVGRDWSNARPRLARDRDCARWLLKDGEAPKPGDKFALPALGKTLREIANRGREGFYAGWVADDIAKKLAAEGSHVTLDDLRGHRGEYATPISTHYRGLNVWECPPPGAGLTALIMFNLLEAMSEQGGAPLSCERMHAEIEITKIAFRERNRHIGDPDFHDVPVEQLLSADFANSMAATIDMAKASAATARAPEKEHRDTTYLTVVDRDRMAVSFINSLFDSFGCARLAPESGVILQNRGACFVVAPGHPNCIGPSKRSLHTIIPAMVCEADRPVFSFGVMGGHYQPVGQVHVLQNMLDFGLDPQSALDCPRAFWKFGAVRTESGLPAPLVEKLAQLGHRIEANDAPLGGGQVIGIDWTRGAMIAGSDSRKDGCALAY